MMMISLMNALFFFFFFLFTKHMPWLIDYWQTTYIDMMIDVFWMHLKHFVLLFLVTENNIVSKFLLEK